MMLTLVRNIGIMSLESIRDGVGFRKIGETT